LSDLRAEIAPHGILDLERVADRPMIDKSRDLRDALKTKRLHLGRHSVVRAKVEAHQPVKIIEHTDHVTERIIEREKDGLSEAKVLELMRQVMSEQEAPKESESPDIQKIVSKAISEGVGQLSDSIREKLDSIKVAAPEGKIEELPIDPKQFADISQRSIEKISKDIEGNITKKGKKVSIINKNIDNIADEL